MLTRHRHHGNLPAHKTEGFRIAIVAAGCRLLFLPNYGPDFNPIEYEFFQAEGYSQGKG